MTGESSPSRKSTQKLTASIRLTSCASVAGTERGAYLLYTDQSRPRNQGLKPHSIASSCNVIFGGQIKRSMDYLERILTHPIIS